MSAQPAPEETTWTIDHDELAADPPVSASKAVGMLLFATVASCR